MLFVARVVAVQVVQSGMLVSCVVLGAGPDTDRLRLAQLGLLFSSVVMEFFSWVFEALGSAPRARSGVINHTYGSLSIMILGEGFIGIALELQRTILGVGLVNTSVYVRAGMTLVVYCNLYGFVFAHFDRQTQMSSGRELFWKWFQLALHFVLLLFLQALLNTILLSSFRDGVLETARIVVSAVTARPDNATLGRFADYIDRVGVDPDFTNFTVGLWNMLDEHNNSGTAVTSRDATVFAYLSETAVKVAEVSVALAYADNSRLSSAFQRTLSTTYRRA